MARDIFTPFLSFETRFHCVVVLAILKYAVWMSGPCICPSLPVSASQVLTLQICVTMPWMNNHLVILSLEVSNMSISGLYLHFRLYNKIVQEFGEGFMELA